MKVEEMLEEIRETLTSRGIEEVDRYLIATDRQEDGDEESTMAIASNRWGPNDSLVLLEILAQVYRGEAERGGARTLS